MRKVILFLLALTMVLSLCACGSGNKDKYVGVWENLLLDTEQFEFQYMYVYEDGTGDTLMKPKRLNDVRHANPFTWEFEEGYFVKRFGLTNSITKYKLEGEYLLDNQGHQAYKLVSTDTSKDINP